MANNTPREKRRDAVLSNRSTMLSGITKCAQLFARETQITTSKTCTCLITTNPVCVCWTVPATHHLEFVLQTEFMLRQSDYYKSAHADIASASRRGRMEPLIMFFLATWVGAQPCRADLAPSHRLASLGHNRSTQAPEVRCANDAAVCLLELQCAVHVTQFSPLQVN